MLPYCAQHTKTELGLVVKPSRIAGAGLGLFTAMDQEFQTDDLIAEVHGQRVTQAELDRRYGDFTAPYGVALSKTVFEDGATARYVGHFANTQVNPAGTRSVQSGTNAKISHNVAKRTVFLKATKRIPPDTEILVYYGKQYQFNEGTRYTTARGFVRKNQ